MTCCWGGGVEEAATGDMLERENASGVVCEKGEEGMSGRGMHNFSKEAQ